MIKRLRDKIDRFNKVNRASRANKTNRVNKTNKTIRYNTNILKNSFNPFIIINNELI